MSALSLFVRVSTITWPSENRDVAAPIAPRRRSRAQPLDLASRSRSRARSCSRPCDAGREREHGDRRARSSHTTSPLARTGSSYVDRAGRAAAAERVADEDRVDRVDELRGRAPVDVERDPRRAGAQRARRAREVGVDVGAAEAVDRLLRIADDRQAARLGRASTPCGRCATAPGRCPGTRRSSPTACARAAAPRARRRAAPCSASRRARACRRSRTGRARPCRRRRARSTRGKNAAAIASSSETHAIGARGSRPGRSRARRARSARQHRHAARARSSSRGDHARRATPSAGATARRSRRASRRAAPCLRAARSRARTRARCLGVPNTRRRARRRARDRARVDSCARGGAPVRAHAQQQRAQLVDRACRSRGTRRAARGRPARVRSCSRSSAANAASNATSSATCVCSNSRRAANASSTSTRWQKPWIVKIGA